MTVKSSSIRYETLNEALSRLEGDGFKTGFFITNGQIRSQVTSEQYPVDRVRVERVARIEGESDPGAETAVYALSIATDREEDKKGVLVQPYGTYSDPDTDEVLNALPMGPRND